MQRAMLRVDSQKAQAILLSLRETERESPMAKQYANFWCILFGCSVKIRRHGVPHRQAGRQPSKAAGSQSVSQSNQTSKQQQEQAGRQTESEGSECVCEREREGEGELAATGATVHNAFPVSNKPTALGQPGFPPESLMSY